MSKVKVAIATDSTAYLPKELIEEYNIHVIPLYVNWEGESLQDGIDITPDAFYTRLKTAKEIPTTSQPSPGQFQEFYKEIAKTADSILGIFVSEPLSGTMDSARAAAQMLPEIPIEIVDSRSVTVGLALIVLAAARAIREGKDAKSAAEVARVLAPKIRLLFVPESLDYLHKGGRIGGAKHLFGSILSIKPVLCVKDGLIAPEVSIRTKRKAIAHMVSTIQQETGGSKSIRVGVLNALAHEEAEQFARQITERVQPVELFHSDLSPAIGTHVGPGTVGFAFYCDD